MVIRNNKTIRKVIHCIGAIGMATQLLATSTMAFADSANASEIEEEVEPPTDSFAIALNPTRDYLILVNDNHEYKFGGMFDLALQEDIVYTSDCYKELTPIEKGASAAFSLLKQYLADEGINIQLFSAYRTKDDQEWVYDYYSNLEGWSETNKVAEPGFSEHHTGLLLNIVVWWPEADTWATETPERTAEDPELFNKIHASLADYGFIDRYPDGKEDITGYPAEPYEIRFVGSSKIAHEIMDNDLTLEEYLNNQAK